MTISEQSMVDIMTSCHVLCLPTHSAGQLILRPAGVPPAAGATSRSICLPQRDRF